MIQLDQINIEYTIFWIGILIAATIVIGGFRRRKAAKLDFSSPKNDSFNLDHPRHNKH